MDLLPDLLTLLISSPVQWQCPSLSDLLPPESGRFSSQCPPLSFTSVLLPCSSEIPGFREHFPTAWWLRWCSHVSFSWTTCSQQSASPQYSKQHLHWFPSLDSSNEVGFIYSSIHSYAQFHVLDIDQRPPESFTGKQTILCCTWCLPTLPALLY